MKKQYKEMEEITIYFNRKIWNSLHNYGCNIPYYEGIRITKDKMYLIFSDCSEEINVLNSSFEDGKWLHCIPRKLWTKKLESFGYIHK